MKRLDDRRMTIKSLENEVTELTRRLELLRATIVMLRQMEGEQKLEQPKLLNIDSINTIGPSKSAKALYELLLPLFENPRAHTVSEMYAYIKSHPHVSSGFLQKADSSFRYDILKLYRSKLLYRYEAEGQSNDKRFWYSTPNHFIENGYPSLELKQYITNALHEYMKKTILDEGG